MNRSADFTPVDRLTKFCWQGVPLLNLAMTNLWKRQLVDVWSITSNGTWHTWLESTNNCKTVEFRQPDGCAEFKSARDWSEFAIPSIVETSSSYS
jgi:hypothetical protein